MIASAAASCSLAITLREVAHRAARARVVEQRAEQLATVQLGERIADHDLEAERLGPGAQHRERLRMAVGVDEEGPGLAPAHPLGHGHGFGGRGRLVEQRGVRELEAGQIGDHLLEVQQRLEPTLADLRLIGRVGRVPAGVLEDVALDHGGRDRAVVAHADHRSEDPVVLGHGRSRASASVSLLGGGRSSGRSVRIALGVALVIRSSSELAPTTSSIALICSSPGPM